MPDNIISLESNKVFVFGSNLNGFHLGGAAKLALKKIRAIWEQGIGLQGQSYAIPTMQGEIDTIKQFVDEYMP